MSQPKTVVCDICGVSQREANHWWKAHRFIDGGCLIMPAKINNSALFTGEQHDLCGEACAMKYLSQSMRGLKK